MDKSRSDVSREEAAQIVARLNRQRRVQIIGLYIVVLAAIPALLSRAAPDGLLGIPFTFWGLLAMALLLAKLILLFAAWRCPRCGASLGSSYHPRYCPGCGVTLVEPDKS